MHLMKITNKRMYTPTDIANEKRDENKSAKRIPTDGSAESPTIPIPVTISLSHQRLHLRLTKQIVAVYIRYRIGITMLMVSVLPSPDTVPALNYRIMIICLFIISVQNELLSRSFNAR